MLIKVVVSLVFWEVSLLVVEVVAVRWRRRRR